MSKPNIVLLFADQHNSRVLGCYGHEQIRTPNLDRLAREGIRFTHAHTQNTICTPSRMCYFTGLYPHNHGYYGLSGPAPVHLPSMLTHLKKNGYRNAIVGKIHLPRGWLSQDCDYVRDVFYQEHADGHSDYKDYIIQKKLWERSEFPLWEEIRALTGSIVESAPCDLDFPDTPEGWIAHESIRFLETVRRDHQKKPFFLFVSTEKPHTPYTPARAFWDLYDESTIVLPPNADNDLSRRHPRVERVRDYYRGGQDHDGKPSWTLYHPTDFEAARRRVLRGYYGCVSQMDAAMGLVIDKLDELGLRENTIVVYASDHGDFAGEHGLIEKAPGIGFGAITRIPFLWSWPGKLPEGRVRDALVETVDVFPTLCDLAGLEIPKYCDGKSIGKALMNDREEVRAFSVTENPWTKTIHTNRYKLVHYVGATTNGQDLGELYDIEQDPWEMRNLYFDPKFCTIVHSLRRELLDWLIETTRVVTVQPNLVSVQPPWENDRPISDEDGRIGKETILRAMEKNPNYM